ncbi:chorismate-binding protein [Aquipuribacter nitratireducens]|uniref:Chorismate-binding protein n=1 Tax=Aquipuribacter nitratireducens TaxID=650104 RepID=A0ABW0GIA4_9MICO
MPAPRVRRLVGEAVPALDGVPAVDVVRALSGLAGARRLAVLSGGWAATAPLLLSADPVEVHEELPGSAPVDPFALLDEPVPLARDLRAPPGAVGGGWVCLLGHALGRRTGRVRGPLPPLVGPALPTVSLARTDHVLRHDGAGWWAEALDPGDGSAVDAARRLADEAVRGLAAAPPGDGTTDGAPDGASLVADVVAPDGTAHMLAVERVVHAVRAGDIAQANVCSRFSLRLRDGGAAAVGAWLALVAALRPARAALVTGPWGALVGASPETYLDRDGDRVTSAPIKGTRPAGQSAELVASAKDSSENVMIVDLVRNDLARVCEPGTVRVEDLLSVGRHAGVEHLVSRVSGTLRPRTGTGAVVAATFPPGSVTGTPKQRASEVTDAVEAAARGAHTGAVGFVGPRLARLAVTIRSLEVAADGTAALGVGGGVVADSTPAEEWHEVLTKAAPLVRALGAEPPRPDPDTASRKGLADPAGGLLETLLATDGHLHEAADHVARLRRSYWEVTGRSLDTDAPDLAAALAAAAEAAGPGTHRVRVRCATTPTGSAPVLVEHEPLAPTPLVVEQTGLVLLAVPAPEHGLERHKWADRRRLDEVHGAAVAAHADDAVLVEPSGALLETTRDCLVATVAPGPDGRRGLVTPPEDGRVLPGVTRRVLLDLAAEAGWAVRLGPLDAPTLESADGLLACNALRGVRWVREVRGAADGGTRATARSWAAPGDGVVALAEMLRTRRRLTTTGAPAGLYRRPGLA